MHMVNDVICSALAFFFIRLIIPFEIVQSN